MFKEPGVDIVYDDVKTAIDSLMIFMRLWSDSKNILHWLDSGSVTLKEKYTQFHLTVKMKD